MMFASGRGDRRENAICDLRGRTEDGVQEALYCYRKQVSKTNKNKLLSHGIISQLRCSINKHLLASISFLKKTQTDDLQGQRRQECVSPPDAGGR